MNNMTSYFVICVNQTVAYNGAVFTEDRYRYAQYDDDTPFGEDKPYWGPQSTALQFDSAEEATHWYKMHRKALKKTKDKAQYDWDTVGIQEIQSSYTKIADEEIPDTLTIEEIKEILIKKQKEADSFDVAAGYDEGYYSGISELCEQVVEMLNKVK